MHPRGRRCTHEQALSWPSCVQLAWRPAQAPGTVPEAAVVTVKGQLLRGSLGGHLQPLPDLAEGRVACVAWSADGSLLALASANCVTVQHLESGRHFRTEFDSKVTVIYLSKCPILSSDMLCVLMLGLTLVHKSNCWQLSDFMQLKQATATKVPRYKAKTNSAFACHLSCRRPRMLRGL